MNKFTTSTTKIVLEGIVEVPYWTTHMKYHTKRSVDLMEVPFHTKKYIVYIHYPVSDKYAKRTYSSRHGMSISGFTYSTTWEMEETYIKKNDDRLPFIYVPNEYTETEEVTISEHYRMEAQMNDFFLFGRTSYWRGISKGKPKYQSDVYYSDGKFILNSKNLKKVKEPLEKTYIIFGDKEDVDDFSDVFPLSKENIGSRKIINCEEDLPKEGDTFQVSIIILYRKELIELVKDKVSKSTSIRITQIN
jgi:hypothetical protein